MHVHMDLALQPELLRRREGVAAWETMELAGPFALSRW
jgi:hypothetical protein